MTRIPEQNEAGPRAAPKQSIDGSHNGCDMPMDDGSNKLSQSETDGAVVRYEREGQRIPEPVGVQPTRDAASPAGSIQ